LLGELDNWDETLAALALGYRSMSLALPLFESHVVDVSPPHLAEHARRFMDVLGLEQAVIGGNSLGGHVALEVALAHPARVTGLILCAASGLLERSFTRGVPHRPDADWVRAKVGEVFFDPAHVTAARVDQVRRIVEERHSKRRLLHIARAAKRRHIEAQLPRIAAPCLLVWGREDRITPPEVAERFHALLPDSELHLLPACGHAPMLEQPQAFIAIVRDWLERTAARRERAGLPVRAAA
jgi:pimeloyl-ACP methyl ester carboxylesterase